MPFEAPVDTVFDAPYTLHRARPSGSVPIRFVYSTEFTLAAAQQDALTAQDALPGGDRLVQLALQRRDGQLLAGHRYR